MVRGDGAWSASVVVERRKNLLGGSFELELCRY